MRKLPFALLPLLSLAACNSSPTVEATNATGAEVAKKVQESGVTDQFISPGQWQMAMKINEMNIPGMPPQAAERMKGMMGGAHSFTQCLTPEDVRKPKEGMFSGDEEGKCKYDHFSMGGGKIDIAMSCGGERPRKMQMNGTYSSNEYHMNVASQGQGKAGQDGMNMRMEMHAKRLGECSAEERRDAARG